MAISRGTEPSGIISSKNELYICICEIYLFSIYFFEKIIKQNKGATVFWGVNLRFVMNFFVLQYIYGKLSPITERKFFTPRHDPSPSAVTDRNGCNDRLSTALRLKRPQRLKSPCPSRSAAIGFPQRKLAKTRVFGLFKIFINFFENILNFLKEIFKYA